MANKKVKVAIIFRVPRSAWMLAKVKKKAPFGANQKMNNQIAQHLNINEDQIKKASEWANVWFVEFTEGRPTFVSKKVISATPTPSDYKAISTDTYYQTGFGAVKMITVSTEKDWLVSLVNSKNQIIIGMDGNQTTLRLGEAQRTIHSMSFQSQKIIDGFDKAPVEKQQVLAQYLGQFN
jgi:hypothetical protein